MPRNVWKQAAKTQRKRRRLWTWLGIGGIALVVVVIVVAVLLPPTASSAPNLPGSDDGDSASSMVDIFRKKETTIPRISGEEGVKLSCQDPSGQELTIQQVYAKVNPSVVAVVKSLMNVLIGLVASVYILWSKETFQAQSKKIIVALLSPKGADHVFYLGRNIYRVFNGFVIGKIVDSAIIGVLCYIGILILKMPYPALIATVIGVTNVIPFFGPIIGLVPCAFLILLVNPLQAFYFVIFILVLQQVDGNVIGPKILGNTVGISGFWVLASITIAASLFGFTGMILGVPVFAILYLLISDSVNEKLRKKSLTTDTRAYRDIQTVDELPKAEETGEK